MEKIELQAQKREQIGKSLNSLRREGFLPSVVYGHNFETVPVQVKYADFEKVFKKAGESTLINLKLGDKEEPVVIKDIQKNPVTGRIIHTDFYKVSLIEKIKANVPVVFVGESEAVKAGGILVKNINEFEVEALPGDLPHEITVDISVLNNMGDHIFVRDLLIFPGEGSREAGIASDKVKIMANPDEMVALVQEPRPEEVEAAPAPSVEEVEVVKKEPSVDQATMEGEEKQPSEEKK